MVAVLERVLCPRLVGRDEQLFVLEDALLAANRGETRLVALGGEAGMGKRPPAPPRPRCTARWRSGRTAAARRARRRQCRLLLAACADPGGDQHGDRAAAAPSAPWSCGGRAHRGRGGCSCVHGASARMGGLLWMNDMSVPAAEVLAEGILGLEEHGDELEAARYRLVLGRCRWEESRPSARAPARRGIPRRSAGAASCLPAARPPQRRRSSRRSRAPPRPVVFASSSGGRARWSPTRSRSSADGRRQRTS
jgi:hypothetical protein